MASPDCDVMPSSPRVASVLAAGGEPTASSESRVKFHGDIETYEPTTTTTNLTMIGSNTKRLAPVRSEHFVSCWMADTGACVDAISSDQLSQRKLRSAKALDDAITYNTAGGPVTVDTAVTLHSNALQGNIEARVLKDTPSIISMGRRCIEEGYGFYWPPGEWPHIIRPDRKRIDCVVQDYIPYVMEEGRGRWFFIFF